MTAEGWTLLLVLVVFLLACYVIAKIIKGAIDMATTKKCPACAETVKNAATKCRYCGTEFKSAEVELDFKTKWKPPR